MTSITFHSGLTKEHWATLSLLAQLGNVGSEVSRALRAKETKNQERLDGALDRMLELLDLTIADPKNSGATLKELCRVREVLCDFFFGENEYSSTPESLDNYFFAFALAARS
jgi:hypothetical protein